MSPLVSLSPFSSSRPSSSSSPSSSADSSSGLPSSTSSGRETSYQDATKEEKEAMLILWRMRPPRPLPLSQTPLAFLCPRLPPTARRWPAPPHLNSTPPNTLFLLFLRSSHPPTPCSSDPQGLAWQGVTLPTTADTEWPGRTPPNAERKGGANNISALVITAI